MVLILLLLLFVYLFFSEWGIQTLDSEETRAKLRLLLAVSVPVEFKICRGPRLTPSRYLDGSILADLDCHLHAPQHEVGPPQKTPWRECTAQGKKQRAFS